MVPQRSMRLTGGPSNRAIQLRGEGRHIRTCKKPKTKAVLTLNITSPPTLCHPSTQVGLPPAHSRTGGPHEQPSKQTQVIHFSARQIAGALPQRRHFALRVLASPVGEESKVARLSISENKEAATDTESLALSPSPSTLPFPFFPPPFSLLENGTR